VGYIGYCATKDYKSAVTQGHTYKPGDTWATYSAHTNQFTDPKKRYEKPQYDATSGLIVVISYVSLEHAKDLALKAYEYWKTKQDIV
jgi:hypothetical protein